MGLYRSLYVLLVSNGSLWVLIGPFKSLSDFMDPNGSSLVLIHFFGSLGVLLRPYGSVTAVTSPKIEVLFRSVGL